MPKNIIIAGGDERFISVANILSKDGFNVGMTAFRKNKEFEKNIAFYESFYNAENADYIILPLPVTKDKLTLFAPLCDEEIYLHDLFDRIKEGTHVFCGIADESIKKSAEKYKFNVIDYFSDEALTILNCIPTAEGAINIAIKSTPYTLFGSNCLVLGFGRVGKILAKSLYALGANTFVEARKKSDLAWIKALGYNSVPLDTLKDEIEKFDIIFNTVPHKILDKDLLSNMKKECVIIDLASFPYGVDIDFVKQNKIKYILASALPGKVAPSFAGKIIAETIENLIYDMEVHKNES